MDKIKLTKEDLYLAIIDSLLNTVSEERELAIEPFLEGAIKEAEFNLTYAPSFLDDRLVNLKELILELASKIPTLKIIDLSKKNE